MLASRQGVGRWEINLITKQTTVKMVLSQFQIIQLVSRISQKTIGFKQAALKCHLQGSRGRIQQCIYLCLMSSSGHLSLAQKDKAKQ